VIFSFEPLKARQGDCFLLHFGTKDEPGLVLIDGGPKQVYQPYLKKRLLEIKAARGLPEEQSLLVDLLMVSHVDDDHIQGLLDLTKEEIVAKDAHQPRLLNVLSFWHNSFDEIIANDANELTACMKKQFGEAAVFGAGGLPDTARLEVEEACSEEPEVVASSLNVLASIEQGFRLRLDAEKLEFPRNPEFGGKLIMARENGKAKDIAQRLKFTVVGPMEPEVKALQKKHLQWLEVLRRKGKPIPQALAAYVDESVPNLSSIVVLAEVDDKRMLLTGDARGDKILEGLQLTGLLGPGQASTMQVDVLKVPHHGSARNLVENFFKRIIANHYVFSGNGDYGNPERETLEMLWKARGDEDYTIHLTYPIKEIDGRREDDWKEQQDKEKKGKKKQPGKAREDWSPERNSLTAFFEDHQNLAKKIRIVEENKPHIIDLIQKV
jgi:beta-lactamase superfamily II metal-dependent hydrolase